jgi:plastocyanin
VTARLSKDLTARHTWVAQTVILMAAQTVVFTLAVQTAECVMSAEPAGATISGTVRYQIDRERKWRYRRYYVEDHKTGYLAEAVVALHSTELRRATYPKVTDTAVVDQRDHRFIPETSAIRAGQSVQFTNNDAANHNVNSRDPLHSFNIAIPSGGELTERFARGGGIRRPIRLGCVFHDNMQAWIFVFEHPFFQVTASDGRYNLSGVPPGEYRLEMGHPAGGLRWSQKITIKADEPVTVDITVSPDDLTKE